MLRALLCIEVLLMAKNQTSIALRTQMVMLKRQGKTQAAIAKELGGNKLTVQQWSVHDYGGDLMTNLKRKEGSPRVCKTSSVLISRSKSS